MIIDTNKREGDSSSCLTTDNRHRNLEDLSDIIEDMREQLVKLAQEKGISNSEVVAVSQLLDEYIVQFQLRMSRKSSK